MNTALSGEYATLVRYFLGELAEAEQEFVEERYMVDQEYSGLRDEVEMDLVDAYVARTLTAQQRHHFEKHYLITSERKEAVRAAYLTKVYRDRVARRAENPVAFSQAGTHKPGPWRAFIPAMAAALALAVIGGGALLMTLRRPAKQPILSARNRPETGLPVVEGPKPAPHEPVVEPPVKAAVKPAVKPSVKAVPSAATLGPRDPGPDLLSEPKPAPENPGGAAQAAGAGSSELPASNAAVRTAPALRAPQTAPLRASDRSSGSKSANPQRAANTAAAASSGTAGTGAHTVANSSSVYASGPSVYAPSAPVSVPAAVDRGPQTIQSKLESEFKLTQTNYDKTDIVTAGSVVTLRKDKVLMLAASSTNPCRNTYKDGQIRQSGPCAANEKLKKFSKFTSRIPGASSVPDSPDSHTFVTGEKFWVTKIQVKDTGKDAGITLEFFTDEIGDTKTRFATTLLIPFGAFTPTPEQALQLVREVITVTSSDDANGSPAQSTPVEAPPSPVEAPAPPPPYPAEIAEGETVDQVVAVLGQPTKKARVGTKEIYYYKDLKVTFVDGKVKDIR